MVHHIYRNRTGFCGQMGPSAEHKYTNAWELVDCPKCHANRHGDAGSKQPTYAEQYAKSLDELARDKVTKDVNELGMEIMLAKLIEVVDHALETDKSEYLVILAGDLTLTLERYKNRYHDHPDGPTG